MKKFLLMTLAMGFVAFSFAQNYMVKQEFSAKKQYVQTEQMIGIEPVKDMTITGTPIERPATRGSRDLSIISIGESANAYGYGYAGGQKSILWADDNLGAFINLHRETAATYSGNLAVDLSLDRGQTFTSNIRLYESNVSGGQYNTDACRYPQGGIYNPMGNTDPANAYYAYFAPILDGSNASDSWGGYGYGVMNLVNTADTTKHLRPTNIGEGLYQYIPDGFTITSDGNAWVTDFNQDWTTGSIVYQNSMIVNQGSWNDTDKDYEYESLIVDCVTTTGDRPACDRIAFAPDGQTGYIVVLADDGSVPFSEGAYYPVVYKTTNGGEDWDDPVGVQIGGPDGIASIVYDWLSDEDLEAFFEPPIPARDEILYTTAFDFDMVVDANGNPHIAVVIGIGSGDYSIYSPANYIAAFDVFSFDGGETWNAYHLGNLLTFRGDFGDLTEDNRINASRTMDGTKVFVSWLDTHFEGYEDNTQPDIFAVGIDPINLTLTETINITEFTEAWLQSFFFVAPEMIFADGDTYTIPFTYEAMDPADPGAPVTFMYIQDWSFTAADFVIQGVEDAAVASNITSVSQNYPNPFNATSVVEVELNESSLLSLEVYNLMGQIVYTQDAGKVAAGTHQLTIDGSQLTNGVYFYTVKAGENTVTRKMIVE